MLPVPSEKEKVSPPNGGPKVKVCFVLIIAVWGSADLNALDCSLDWRFLYAVDGQECLNNLNTLVLCSDTEVGLEKGPHLAML